MRKFKHFNKTKRIQLELLLNQKKSKREIAQFFGVHISTIYREIKRGLYMKLDSRTYEYIESYSSDIAEGSYQEYLKAKGPVIKLSKDSNLVSYIEDKIVNDKYSPEVVLGEIKRKNLKFDTTICVRTLYNYIEKGYFKNITIKHLAAKTKKSNRNVIKRVGLGTSIEYRPNEINNRNSFGHWEMDCVCGPSKPSLLVLTERLTRKELIFKIENQKANSVIKVLNKIEYKLGKHFKTIFKSITVDNGVEFSNYDGMQKSIFNKYTKRTIVYFCHPYCSYERGSNERMNREIRRWIPKGSDISKYDSEYIRFVQDWLNDYPKPILNFDTSNNLFNIELNKIGVSSCALF